MKTVPELYRRLKRESKLHPLYVYMHLIFLTETHVVILTQSVEVAGELCSRNCPETQHDGVQDAVQMMSDVSRETGMDLLWLFIRLFGAATEQPFPALVKKLFEHVYGAYMSATEAEQT